MARHWQRVLLGALLVSPIASACERDTAPQRELPSVSIDPAQLEQVRDEPGSLRPHTRVAAPEAALRTLPESEPLPEFELRPRPPAEPQSYRVEMPRGGTAVVTYPEPDAPPVTSAEPQSPEPHPTRPRQEP